ncbi:hypothetical protein MHBO_001748 [Bonamia ostreae]|uniref:Uncharacterized protein n=1 Tax=Bonamia ostreae TaxID=126728 RepID=A0ABV2AKU5_9EUKA
MDKNEGKDDEIGKIYQNLDHFCRKNPNFVKKESNFKQTKKIYNLIKFDKEINYMNPKVPKIVAKSCELLVIDIVIKTLALTKSQKRVVLTVFIFKPKRTKIS